MRWFILTGFVLVIAAVLGLALTSTSGQAGDLPLEGKTVCIDPGHGGLESGAIYQKQGRNGWTLIEKEINLDVAKNLRTRLEVEGGATVVMTRTDNNTTVSLDARVITCNDSGADITVSLHTNSTYSPRWDGSMTLMSKNEDGPLAGALQLAMYNGLKVGWDGRFTDYGINVDDWFIPTNTTMPAVILEPVFLSNRDEAEALGEAGGRRGQIAQAEYDGILAYFALP